MLKYVFIVFVLFAVHPAYADCTGPAGLEGQIMYNSTHKIMQFCDGTDWWSMKETGNGPCATGDSGGDGGGGGSPSTLSVADVFSTDLYTGNGSTQTITNGIDLAGEGGLVWTKKRNTAISSNYLDNWLTDSERTGNILSTNRTDGNFSTTGAEPTLLDGGYSVGSYPVFNESGSAYVAWTFREAPKFFDIVTYTGDGTSGREIAHDLGVVPGMVVVKRTSTADGWYVQHNSNFSSYGFLQSTNAFISDASGVFNAAPTSTHFTLGNSGNGNNGNGETYVAYLFAHDDSADGIIQCGSYTGNNTTQSVTLGWEPQFLLVKNTSQMANWRIFDNKRSPSNPRNDSLNPDGSDSELNDNSTTKVDFIADGVRLLTDDIMTNRNNSVYIYCAIRNP